MKKYTAPLLLASLFFNSACGLDGDCTSQGKNTINDGYQECSQRNRDFRNEQEERAERYKGESPQQKRVNEIW